MPHQSLGWALQHRAHGEAVVVEALLEDALEMEGDRAYKTDVHGMAFLETEEESLDEGVETVFHQGPQIRMVLVLARKLGEVCQIARRLLAVVKVGDEVLQRKVIGLIELLSQVVGHEAVIIRPCHFPADVHPATFVADEVTQRHRTLHYAVSVIDAGVGARPEDAGYASLVTQHGVACRHQVVRDADFRLGPMALQHLFY